MNGISSKRKNFLTSVRRAPIRTEIFRVSLVMKPKISRVYIILRDDDEKRSDIFNSRNQAIQNLFRQNSILSMNLLSLAHVVPVRKNRRTRGKGESPRPNSKRRDCSNVFILMAFREEEKVGKTRNLDARVKVALIDSGRKAAADPGICQRRQETWPT